MQVQSNEGCVFAKTPLGCYPARSEHSSSARTGEPQVLVQGSNIWPDVYIMPNGVFCQEKKKNIESERCGSENSVQAQLALPGQTVV
jgi:hypothetical protein